MFRQILCENSFLFSHTYDQRVVETDGPHNAIDTFELIKCFARDVASQCRKTLVREQLLSLAGGTVAPAVHFIKAIAAVK